MHFDPLFVPAFAGGVVTFLAPCTLPLLPAYLAFISGVPVSSVSNEEKIKEVKSKIILNSLAYVVGFSVVFILLGSVMGASGIFLSKYRWILLRAGGVLILIFGLFMVSEGRFKFLSSFYKERRLNSARFLRPGNMVSSFLFGATFALGWTPCIGPILGTILTLAAAGGEVLRGIFLLGVFSLGLGLPFMFVSLTIAYASRYLNKILKYLDKIYLVAGVFLIFIGLLLIFNLLPLWTSFFYFFL